MTPEEAIKLLRSGGASCRIWINMEAVADVIEQQQKQIQKKYKEVK